MIQNGLQKPSELKKKWRFIKLNQLIYECCKCPYTWTISITDARPHICPRCHNCNIRHKGFAHKFEK